MSSAVGSHHLDWTSITRAVETPKLIIVRGGGGVVCVIPKRAIQSVQLIAIRSVFTEHLGAKAELG
jgi:carbamate kinase